MIIASQLDDYFNECLFELTRQKVVQVKPGDFDQFPAEIDFLVAAPFAVDTPAPVGWPFGLKFIQLLTSGIDGYPEWFLKSVHFETAQGVAAESIAEYVLAIILEDIKNFDTLWVKHPTQWTRRFLGSMRSSTIGIVGMGAIGKKVADYVSFLGAEVLAVKRPSSSLNGCVKYLENLEEVVENSDFLVLCIPSSVANYKLLDEKIMSRAKDGMHIINVGRGDVIDEVALIKCLENRIIRRATLDVASQEPLPENHDFYINPAIRLSPHTSAITKSSRYQLASKAADNFKKYELIG